MKILTDYHHSSLYSSFLYTLETRLGHEVYRCIGREWFEKGYWRINRQEDTIQQYLGTYGYKPDDGTPVLNDVMWVKDKVYYSKDPNTNQIHKAIEYKTFLDMDFDVIIASIPKHIEPFKKLAELKNAKFILQVGNMWELPYSRIPNLMASVAPRQVPCHSVFYHQEFDTNVFSHTKSTKSKEIHNYMNVLHNYPEALEYFLELEKLMPDYKFKMFGSQNRDGSITGIQDLADSMKKARWIFHFKQFGDGYGHVIHNAFAVGRPIITRKRDYEGKLAGVMIRDKNSIILDGMSPGELADKIRNSEDLNEEMSIESRRIFDEFVNFDKESKEIELFLKNLI